MVRQSTKILHTATWAGIENKYVHICSLLDNIDLMILILLQRWPCNGDLFHVSHVKRFCVRFGAFERCFCVSVPVVAPRLTAAPIPLEKSFVNMDP